MTASIGREIARSASIPTDQIRSLILDRWFDANNIEPRYGMSGLNTIDAVYTDAGWTPQNTALA